MDKGPLRRLRFCRRVGVLVSGAISLILSREDTARRNFSRAGAVEERIATPWG